jgi:hypothetical protein
MAISSPQNIPIGAIPYVQRVLTMPVIFLFYLKTFVFPKDLFILQQWFITQPDSQFFVSLLTDSMFLFGIITLGIWIYRRRSALFASFLFFTFWFLIGVGFHIQLIHLDMTVSDRWFYFPMVGMLGMIGIALETIRYPKTRLRYSATVAVIAIITLFSLRTLVQNTYWQNGISLFSYNVTFKNHDVWNENFLAEELARAGRFGEAQKILENVIIRYPIESYSSAVSLTSRINLINNLAVIEEGNGDIPKAKTLYEKILDSEEAEYAYYEIARIVLLKEGNPQEAKKVALKGLQKYPNGPYLWEILALAEYKLGNQQDALNNAKKAVDLLPSPETEKVYDIVLNHEGI